MSSRTCRDRSSGASTLRTLLALAVLLIPVTVPVHAQVPPQLVPIPGMAERVSACMACHGEQGRAGPDGYYPRLAGKPEGYLLHQLQAFRDGRRRYPVMQYLLANMSDDYLRQIAHFFAEQHPPYPPPPSAPAMPAAPAERARQLVNRGQPQGAQPQLPACAACHGASMTGQQPGIPGLLGLPRDYIVAQLGAWKNGARQARLPDCMATIAQRLTPEDIDAVSTWLSQQPVPADARPAQASGAPLPLACGSQQPDGSAAR